MLEIIANAGIGATTTAASGTDEVKLGSASCSQVLVVNNTGTTLSFRYGSTAAPVGNSIDLKDGFTMTFRGLQDAGQIWVKRADQSVSQVSFKWLWEQAEEIVSAAGIGATTTAASGTDEINLGTIPCDQITIINDTGATLSVRYGTVSAPAGDSIEIPNGWSQPFRGLSAASNLWIKRTDNSISQVTAKWIWEKA